MMELAKEIIRLKSWRWLPGMKVITDSGNWFRVEERIKRLHGEFKHAYPDLNDHATIGCLIQLAREIYNDASVTTSRHSSLATDNSQIVTYRWVCSYFDGKDWKQSHGSSEVEAICNCILESSLSENKSEEFNVITKYNGLISLFKGENLITEIDYDKFNCYWFIEYGTSSPPTCADLIYSNDKIQLENYMATESYNKYRLSKFPNIFCEYYGDKNYIKFKDISLFFEQYEGSSVGITVMDNSKRLM